MARSHPELYNDILDNMVKGLSNDQRLKKGWKLKHDSNLYHQEPNIRLKCSYPYCSL